MPTMVVMKHLVIVLFALVACGDNISPVQPDAGSAVADATYASDAWELHIVDATPPWPDTAPLQNCSVVCPGEEWFSTNAIFACYHNGQQFYCLAPDAGM